MKKTGILLTALLLTAVLTGCGASETDTADIQAAETTVAGTAADSERESETESRAESESETEAPAENESGTENAGSIAGNYYCAGYMLTGAMPEGFDKETVEGEYKHGGMTIAEDGSFSFLGKDYQLTEAGASGSHVYFSIQGSGFDMEKYRSDSSCGDQDYAGPCAIEQVEQHMTINGEDNAYMEYHMILKDKGTESGSGYYTFMEKTSD